MIDPRWFVLQGAKPELLRALGVDGVVRIEFVADAGTPGIAVWLGLTTDAERDALPGKDPLLARVRDVLRLAGLREDDLAETVTVAQSQETVDREFEGTWFRALR